MQSRHAVSPAHTQLVRENDYIFIEAPKSTSNPGHLYPYSKRSRTIRAAKQNPHPPPSEQIPCFLINRWKETHSQSPNFQPPSLLNLCLASTSILISSSVKRSAPAQFALLVLDRNR